MEFDPDTPWDDDDDTDGEVERMCREALTRFEDGDPDAARELAAEAQAIDTDHPFPLFVLGVIAEYENDLVVARHLADLALERASTNADTIGLRVQVHLREHEFEAAEQLLRFGIAHNPDDPSLHEGLARVALATGRYDDAVAAAVASLRLEPDNPGAHAVRNAALEELGDSEAVMAALRQTVQLHPDDPWSMVELAALETELGNVDRASLLLTRAHRILPRDQMINEARSLIDGARAGRLLAPLPPLLRWIREFPGGLAGFLLGFLLTALPMHALVMSRSGYLVPVITLMGGWACIATYAWIGPAILTRRLNDTAASTALARVTRDLDDPTTSDHGLDIGHVGEAVSLLVASCRFQTAAGLLDDVSGRANSPEAADELRRLAAWLRHPGRRVRQLALRFPAGQRVLIMAAAVTFIGARPVAQSTGLLLWQTYLIALALILMAALIRAVELATASRVHEVIGAAAMIEDGGPTMAHDTNSAPDDPGDLDDRAA